MPSIDTAVFQLSALALLGLILVVAVVALLRLGSLKRAIGQRPSTTAADVPFAEPEARPVEAQQETAAPEEHEPAHPGPEPEGAAEQPESEAAGRAPDTACPPPEAEAPATEAEPGPGAEEPAAVAEPSPEGVEPELVRESPPARESAPEEAELQPEPVAEDAVREGAEPEPVAAEAVGEGAEPVAAAAGSYWPVEETPPGAEPIRDEEPAPAPAGEWDEGPVGAPVEGRDEPEAESVGGDERHDRVDTEGAAGAPTVQQPAVGDAGAPGEVGAAPSTVSAQQQQVAAGVEAESEFAAERTWDDISQQTEAPANGDPSRPEPEGVLTAGWAYDWAREMPEEQPIERDGRWWFKRGGELLLYDETTAQWVPAPVPESPGGSESAGNSNGVEFGGAAASTQSSFWKCPSCGAVNGSTASTCRMCFAARP